MLAGKPQSCKEAWKVKTMHIEKFQSFQWNWTVFIALGVALMGMGGSLGGISPVLDFASTAIAICGAIFIMAGLVYTLPSTNSLEIKDSGFSYRTGLTRTFCRWEDCSEFSAWKKTAFGILANELVTFDWIGDSSRVRANLEVTGKNASLPGTYGLGAEELAQKLNHFRNVRLSGTNSTI